MLNLRNGANESCLIQVLSVIFYFLISFSALGKRTVQVKINENKFTDDFAQLLHVSREITATALIHELMKPAAAFPEPSKTYSQNAIVLKMKNTNGERDATTVGHVPDGLAESCTSHYWRRKSR